MQTYFFSNKTFSKFCQTILKISFIVRKGVSTLPPFQNHPPLLGFAPPFLKIPHPRTLPTNRPSQVFLIDRNASVKLSSANTIHIKQQDNVGFFIFKFPLKYMLDHVYVNKIHARIYLYIISLYYREGFFHAFNFFVVSKGIFHILFQNS